MIAQTGAIILYITQEIADTIKKRAKHQKVSMKEMLAACDMNINAISEFGKGKQLSCISLARIADYLDCSVDYLLGRTDKPEVNR
jgi:transcriptional regulator with XRE-family HTH domain|nr:MAG TPA: repressor protein [Caudoviricetes sp.]